jgi:hypothetical protein
MTATPSPPPAHRAGRLAHTLTGRASGPLLQARQGLRVAAAGLLLLFPEITVGLLVFDAAKTAQRRRCDTHDPERGDAIQWVIVTAIGAAIAVTVGAIIFNKLETKANNIDVTTPGAH